MDLAITNVHLDLGAGLRGTDMGPSAIHVAGLAESLQRLGHRVAERAGLNVDPKDTVNPGDPKVRYLPVIERICTQLADTVTSNLAAGHTPLVLGGDHSLSMGSIAGVCRHLREKNERLGVIWVDAHTDMNLPETSPSGNIHGMPLSVLLGQGPETLVNIGGQGASLQAEDVAIIGVRDVDRSETGVVHQSGVRVYSMSEIDRRGVGSVIDEAIAHVSRHTSGIHLSFDLDGVDPRHAPGVGTPVRGGLSLRESHLICETVAATNRLLSMDMVELNPTRDITNQTAELAVWLIESALGKTIL